MKKAPMVDAEGARRQSMYVLAGLMPPFSLCMSKAAIDRIATRNFFRITFVTAGRSRNHVSRQRTGNEEQPKSVPKAKI